MKPDPFRQFEAFAWTDNRNQEKKFRLHRHQGFEIIYYVRGSSTVHAKNKYYTAVQGNLVVHFPGVIHEEWYHPGDCHMLVLRFPRACLRRLPPIPGTDQIQPVMRLPWPNRFGYLFEQIVLEHGQADHWSRALISAYLAQFILLLQRALAHHLPAPSGQDNSRRLSHVMDIIHQAAAKSLPLHDMARAAGLSASHFSHLFKQWIKIPPRQYAIQVKLAEAKTLLATTTQSVAEIARTLGYDNPYYFSRLFKTKCGRTPSAFRKKAGKCIILSKLVH